MTCYDYKGASVVDYFILDDYLVPKVVSFKISAPHFRSCHSMLHLTLKIEPITIEEHLPKDLPICYKWNNASRDLYKIALANTFSYLEMTISNNKLDTGDIDSAVDQVGDIFVSAANRCLTKIRRKKKKKVSNIKENGMIMIANQIKQRLQNLSYIAQKFPTDPTVRGNLISTKKHFRKLIKYKYNKWQDLILQSLINVHSTNPKEYWKLVKSLKQNQFDKSPHNQSDIIDPVTWYDYFKDLNEEPKFKTNDFHVNIDKIIDNYSIIAKKMVHVLDTKITAIEITITIGKLKFNKSAVNNSIYNGMIKSGSEILLSSLCKLYNLILVKGYFPPKWTVGYIVPIYESESPDNPSNYRGISI